MQGEDLFDQAAVALLEDVLQQDPVTATYLGRHDLDGRLPDQTAEGALAALGLVRRGLHALERLPDADLRPDQRLDRDLLRWHVDLAAFQTEDLGRHLLGEHPVENLASALHPLLTREFAPPTVRASSLAGRLAATERYLREARTRFQRPVRLWVEDELATCRTTAELIDTVRKTLSPHLKATQGSDLERAALSAQSALEDFAGWLRRDALPRAGEGWPLGREAFDRLVELRRLGMTADEVQELGRQASEDIDRALAAECRRLHPGGDLASALAAQATDVPATFEDILAEYRSAIGRARDLVESSGFATVPRDERLDVEETPAYAAVTIQWAAYVQPEMFSPGPHRGIYLVTRPSDRAQFEQHNRAAILNVSYHEAYPGHHLQSVRAALQRSPLRALVAGFEFIEGWAHYCEEEMLRAAPEAHRTLRLAQLLDAQLRALRIRMDLGLHRGGLSLEECERLMVERTGAAPGYARAEAIYYTRAPGCPMSYLLGKVLVQRLRAEAERRPGFSARDFHDRLLAQGNLPLWAMRRVLLEEGGAA